MKKNKKKFDPTPKFAIGDIIKHPRYGIGVIRQIDDRMFPNYEFFYDADFTGRKGDGTKVWLPKVWSEKNCEVVKRAA